MNDFPIWYENFSKRKSLQHLLLMEKFFLKKNIYIWFIVQTS